MSKTSIWLPSLISTVKPIRFYLLIHERGGGLHRCKFCKWLPSFSVPPLVHLAKIQASFSF